jgi:hypothetical protein
MGNITPQQFREMEIRLHGTSRKPVERESQAETIAESDLQDHIVAYCRSKGWFPVYSGMHMHTSTPVGTMDFIIYADRGRVFAIETKSKNGKQKPEQIGVQLMLERLGHKYHLVRSYEQFLEVVR